MSDAKRLALAISCVALAMATPAAAAISCTLSGTGISFGSYDTLSQAQADVTGTLSLTCTGSGTITYVVSLSPGASGDQENRYMTSGSNRLRYQIYNDGARSQVWGDGTGATVTRSNTTTFTSGTATRTGNVWASILAGQRAKAGSYSDTLTAVVTY